MLWVKEQGQMGWKLINGNRYYYRSKRQGGRVASEYIGGDERAELTEIQDQEYREEKREEREAQRETMAAILAEDRETGAAVQAVQDLVTASLLVAGWHQHRGHWRKRRKRNDD